MAPPASDDTVWYLAYGSNLSGRRLQRYLDRAPGWGRPLEVRATTLAHRLFFAYESSVWTGGSAFVDPDPGTEVTLVRAWRLTREQFVSVLAQENHRPQVQVHDAVFGLGPGMCHVADERRYGLVLGCESPDHRPALTFTTPDVPLPEHNAPSERYVETIVSGLVDGHGLTEAEARAYLARRCA